jgi:bile acid:Na+ symporter, BASS family
VAQRVAVAVLVVVMMLAIGLRTAPSELRAVARRPLPLLAMLAVNVVLVPLVALLVTTVAELPPGTAVGLLLCAASPGGPMGPLFADQAHGHRASAVTAMVVLATLAVLTVPSSLGLLLGVSAGIEVNRLVLPMIGTLFGFQLLPLAAGMAIRRWAPKAADKLARPANIAANLMLVGVILGLLATKWRVLVSIGALGLALCVLLVLANLALGASTSRDAAERRSYAIVTGVRNISLALLLSATFFQAPETDAAILTFGLFTMVLPWLAALALRRRSPGRAVE